MQQDEIISAIMAAYEREPDINTHEFPISITLGETLRLNGEVEHIIAKRKAHRVAVQVARTESIDDRLTVRPGEPRSDAEILHSALNAVSQEPAFANLVVRELSEGGPDTRRDWIEVGVSGGIVRLEGYVGSLSHRRLAEVTAWWVPGSRAVHNRLHVHPPEEETDGEISDIVRLVLEKDPSIDASQLRIDTRDREVTLHGVVHSKELKHIAAEDCWCIPGVHAVHNEIDVIP